MSADAPADGALRFGDDVAALRARSMGAASGDAPISASSSSSASAPAAPAAAAPPGAPPASSSSSSSSRSRSRSGKNERGGGYDGSWSSLRLPDDVERATVLFSLLCGAVGALALGVFMLWVGVHGASLACEVPLARFAVVDGSLSLLLAVLQVVLAVGLLPGTAAARGSLRGAWLVVGAAVLVALVAAALGVRVWGTVLAFGDGLWGRMAAADAAALPCAPALYNPAALASQN